MSSISDAQRPSGAFTAVVTRKSIVLTPGLTGESIADAFAKMERYYAPVDVLYLNPSKREEFIEATTTMETTPSSAFLRESRYSTSSRTSWSEGREFHGSSGDLTCAEFFHTEGRHVMGYFWGATVVADPELPLDEIRVRSEQACVGEWPILWETPFPVEWAELSTQGFFYKTATCTRKATYQNVVLYADEKVQEQIFEARGDSLS